MKKEELHHKQTHCFYCRRKYGFHKHVYILCGQLLKETKDHIISKFLGGKNHVDNYISCCGDCNAVKGSMDAKTFAEWLGRKIKRLGPSDHPMYYLFPVMKFRAWKLYNKKQRLYQKSKSASDI